MPDELWQLLQNPQSSAHGARHLGDALVRSGLLTVEQLSEALATQAQQRSLGIQRQLGQQLVESGLLTEAQLRHVIAGWLGNRVLDPSLYLFDQEALALVPRSFAEREAVLPLLLQDDILVLAMADPLDKRLLDELRFMTQRRIVAVLAAPGTLMPSVARAYEPQFGAGELPRSKEVSRASSRDLVNDLQAGAEVGREPEADVVSESDNTLVRLINSMIAEADRAEGLRHPHRDPARAAQGQDQFPHRRRAAALPRGPVALPLCAGRPHQDHGGDGHLRAPQAPGRQDRLRPLRRPARPNCGS